ncbi:MAG: ion transporter, partial [Enterococcus sp.]
MKLLENKYYEITIIILAIVSIVFVILDFSNLIDLNSNLYKFIDGSILIIFAFDYFYRLFSSKEKLKFIRQNIFDLIAILPFNSIFSFFRVARIFRIARITRIARLSRLVGMIGKLTSKVDVFLKTNSFKNVLYISLVVILISATTYSIAEGESFVNSLWWAIVTTTTVGYGDISPSTILGKLAAILLMFVGVG